jgi:hypothetical protein
VYLNDFDFDFDSYSDLHVSASTLILLECIYGGYDRPGEFAVPHSWEDELNFSQREKTK